MGIQDRDYWRERYNKKTGYTETSAIRKSGEDSEPPAISQEQLDQIWKPAPLLSGWPLFLFRFFWYSCVFYAAVRLLNRLFS